MSIHCSCQFPLPSITATAENRIYSAFLLLFMNSGFCRLSLFALLLVQSAAAAPWPGWRGADGCGVSTEKDLPLNWSAASGVKWKVALPQPGNSTPVVWGDRLYHGNQGSDCFVLRASPGFEVFAHNPLNDGLTNASPAVSDGNVFIRTHAHLWCIGK